MKKSGPGKWFRKGITLIEVIAMFPDDESAERWFASMRWPDGPACPRCRGSSVQSDAAHPSMPYRCRGCGKRFSVRTGSVMADTKLGYRTRAVALFLLTTGIKGVSSMKLHRDLGISRKLPHGVRGTAQRPRLRHGGTDAAHGAGLGRPDVDLLAADRQGRGRGLSGARRAERGSPLRARASRSVRFTLGARVAPDPACPGATPVRPGPSMQAVERRGSAVFGPRRACKRLARGALPPPTGFHRGMRGGLSSPFLVQSAGRLDSDTIPPLRACRGRTRMTRARHRPPCSEQFSSDMALSALRYIIPIGKRAAAWSCTTGRPGSARPARSRFAAAGRRGIRAPA